MENWSLKSLHVSFLNTKLTDQHGEKCNTGKPNEFLKSITKETILFSQRRKEK